MGKLVSPLLKHYMVQYPLR